MLTPCPIHPSQHPNERVYQRRWLFVFMVMGAIIFLTTLDFLMEQYEKRRTVNTVEMIELSCALNREETAMICGTLQTSGPEAEAER